MCAPTVRIACAPDAMLVSLACAKPEKRSVSAIAALRYRVRMKLLALAALASTLSFVLPASLAADAVPLFNGKDLTGWIDVNTSASTWTVAKDETGTPVIKCTGVPTGILRTEKAYENFVLEFDWKHLSEPATPVSSCGAIRTARRACRSRARSRCRSC